jgi:hypothetical protein
MNEWKFDWGSLLRTTTARSILVLLVVMLLQWSGQTVEVANETAQQIVDAVLNFLVILGIGAAGTGLYGRATASGPTTNGAKIVSEK